MRKIAVLLVFLLMFLTSCSAEISPYDAVGEAYICYETNYPVSCFVVADDLSVCALCLQNNEITPLLVRYDPDGNIISSDPLENYNADRSPMSAKIFKNKVYILSSKNCDPVIMTFDLDSKSIENTLTLQDTGYVDQIVCADDDHLYLRVSSNAAAPSDGSNYLLAKLNTATGIIENTSKDLISDASCGEDGFIYSYGSCDGKYCFSQRDKNTFDVIKTIEKSIDGVSAFCFDDRGVVFYSPNSSNSALSLCYASLDNDGISEIYPKFSAVSADNICVKNGFSFILNNYTGKLERLKNSVYIRRNKPIKMISSYSYLTSQFSAGYCIENQEKTDEELSLAVLSNDSDFDLFYLSSRQNICRNLKENGVFYPLNEVDHVSEYIDACFTGIKQAVTDNDGNIVMIPIDISVPVLVVNNEFSDISGIEFTLEDKSENDFYFAFYPYADTCFNLYLRNNDSFDTEEFRALADDLKKLYSLPLGDPEAEYQFIEGGRGFVCSTSDIRLLQTTEYLINSDKVAVRPVNYKNDCSPSAYCTFICVNPSSENLAATLEYVSSLCEYLLDQKNSFMLSDKALYTDSSYARSLYSIYENAQVDFCCPKDLYFSEFQQYLNNELSLDDFITEADRKLKVYLNE